MVNIFHNIVLHFIVQHQFADVDSENMQPDRYIREGLRSCY